MNKNNKDMNYKSDVLTSCKFVNPNHNWGFLPLKSKTSICCSGNLLLISMQFSTSFYTWKKRDFIKIRAISPKQN